MPANRSSFTMLPPVARKKRRDFIRHIARLLCALLAIVGFVPIASALVLRSTWARGFASRETTRIVREQGFEASYDLSVRLWPVSIVLKHVRVESKDGGAPLLQAKQIVARPKLFALLAGKVVIDEVEAEQPNIRVVYMDRKIVNLAIDIPESKDEVEKPWPAPFEVVSLSDASFDLSIDGIHGFAQGVDLDVTAEEEHRGAGAAFEVALHVGSARVQMLRSFDETDKQKKAPVVASYEDTLCHATGRFRVDKKGVLVRRLSVAGFADLDGSMEGAPDCTLPTTDKRRVEATASQLNIRFPTKKRETPALSGRVSARAPIAIVERIGGLPPMDGVVSVTGELRYAADAKLPELEDGKVEVTGIKIDQYAFAKRIEADVTIRKDVVRSPMTKLWVADGTAVLSDATIEPMAPGYPLKVGRVDVKDANFTTLMRDLGIARRPHVTWDIQTARGTDIRGTLDPLKIDSAVEANTANFAVYAGPADDPARERIISISGGHVLCHIAVRPEGVHFQHAHVDLPHGMADGGYVFLGYKNDLRVDVAHVKSDLVDITPLAKVPVAGVVEGDLHVTGKFGDPHLKADASIQNFVLAQIPFGTVTAAHGEFQANVLDLSGVHAIKAASPYEMVTGRIDFRGPSKLKVDGVLHSPSMSMRDLFSIFKLEDDPRYKPIDGKIDSTVALRVILGGPEDPCGDGRIDVAGKATVRDLELFGEHFDDGNADFALRWFDRDAGLAGAELDVHGVTLNKVHEAGAMPQGWLLGQASLHLGGDLRGTAVIESMPFARIDNLGKVGKQIEGTFSALLEIDGKVDAFRVQGDVEATPIRFANTQLGSSRVHVKMTQKPGTVGAIPTGDHRPRECRSPRTTPFKRDEWVADVSSQGDIVLDGSLFDRQISVEHVAITRQRSARVTGKVGLNQINLSKISHMLLPPPDVDDAKEAFGGELSGDLTIDRLVVDDLPHASLRFAPRSLTVARDKQSLVLRPTKDPLVLDNDTLVVPPYTLDLTVPNQLKGAVSIRGTVARLIRDPELLLAAEISPIDLAFLAGVIPKVTRAQGTLTGGVRVTGRARDPDVDGVLRVRDAELAVQGLPGAISGIEIDFAASASEARVTRATATFAGGDLGLTGRMSLRGSTFGAFDFLLEGRGLHLTPTQGLAVGLDADLRISQNPNAQGVTASRLPHISGEVTLNSFEYTRATNIVPDIGGFRVGAAKRTAVDVYDPAQDSIILGPDLTVRSRTPLKIRNNLVDVQLAIDQGGLQVSGSNQRVGLRGGAAAVPGGHLRLFANEFEIRRATVKFDDPTRINPHVDAIGVTEYRRYTSTQVSAAPAAGGATAGVGGRSGGLWRIGVHAIGDAEDLRLEMTSDPALSQEDIFLLLTIGLTRAELDQVQAGSVAAAAAFEALGTATGADRAVKQAIPVIDDFRFGSAYSPRTGRSEPQLTIGRRVADNVRASVTTGLTEDRQLRTLIEWRLSQRLSVQGAYDNLNTTSSSTIGNLGFDVRWRLEFE